MVKLKIFTCGQTHIRAFDSLRQAVDSAIETIRKDTPIPAEIIVDEITVWRFMEPKESFDEVIQSLLELL